MEFKQLQLKPELLQALENIKLTKPTEVQIKAIPILLQGKDLIVRSKTGSGKTFAFLLPILQTLSPELTTALRKIPHRYRLTIETVAKAESCEEAANKLNIPVGTVTSRLFRARKMLKTHLAGYRF